MDQNNVKQLIEGLVNQYIWWFIGAAALIWIKGIVENMVEAAVFVFSRDYNVDDEVLIGGTKKARIVRQTFTKTVFYIYATNTRLIIPNREFDSLRCEKLLPGCTESTE